MPPLPADVQFLNGPFKKIEGWCVDEAAWLTTHLLRFQQQKQRVAPAFEIGVAYGKYLSVLQNCSRNAGVDVVGFDTFQWVSVEAVEEKMIAAFGSMEGIRLIPGDSTKMSPAELRNHLNGRNVSFVSIDGAHSPDAVFSDLQLTEPALTDWGIVAIDDFLNPHAIGATDGTMRYWYKTATNLVPFCYCRNKLFAAPKAFAEEYGDQIPIFAEENQHLRDVKAMINNRNTHGLHWIRQDFLGTQIWII
jgi:hypothetical protein